MQISSCSLPLCVFQSRILSHRTCLLRSCYVQGSYMAPQNFQFILRILNTNVDGRRSAYALYQALACAASFLRMRCKLPAHACNMPFPSAYLISPLAEILYALTVIPGVGRRISNIVCKKAEVNMHKRAGEMTPDEIERVVAILQNPRQFKIPDWMLNRQKDRVDGKSYQLVSNAIAVKLRDDIETLKKIRAHRGLRHYWSLKVRGQHTCSTGRGRSQAIAAASAGK